MKIYSTRRISINGVKWTVSEVDVSPLPDTNGCCYCSSCRILVEKGISPKKNFEQTLIHELTHAFIWSYGFIQVNFNEETVCNFVSVYLKDIYDIANKYMKQRKIKQ